MNNQIKMINQTKLKIIFREFICTTKTKIKENVIKQVKCQQVKIECQNVFSKKKHSKIAIRYNKISHPPSALKRIRIFFFWFEFY